MASTMRIVNMVCTFLLVAVFAMAGVMKLTPIISPEFHSEMKRDFRSFANIPPASLLKLEPDVYRTIVGVVELVCVACLVCPHSHVQMLGHYVLMCVMVGAVWTHYTVGDSIDKFVPALVCLGLLILRLYACRKLKVKVKIT